MLNNIMDNLRISLPILLTRLLGIFSNLIVMYLISKLGTTALSASALIMGIFSICILLLMAFSFSICALIAEAQGSDNNKMVGDVLWSSFVLNTVLTVPILIIFYYISPLLKLLQQPDQVIILVEQYMHGMMIGFLPMIWAAIVEQFLVGIGKTRYIVYLSIINIVMLPAVSYFFIFNINNSLDLAMLGAGFAISVSAIISFVFLIIIIVINNWHIKYQMIKIDKLINYPLIIKLYKLGWPISFQFASEFLAYTFITIMMGWTGIMALAAQQIILQFTSVVIMVPTSISQATTVLVGLFYGKNDIKNIKRQVNSALVLVTLVMLLIGFVYISIPELLAKIYMDVDMPQETTASIMALCKSLLLIAAITQLFDGVRNVIAGAYRGLQKTKIIMLATTPSLWLISIPLAYLFGFIFADSSAVGVRIGFSIGVFVAATLLTILWWNFINSFENYEINHCEYQKI